MAFYNYTHFGSVKAKPKTVQIGYIKKVTQLNHTKSGQRYLHSDVAFGAKIQIALLKINVAHSKRLSGNSE